MYVTGRDDRFGTFERARSTFAFAEECCVQECVQRLFGTSDLEIVGKMHNLYQVAYSYSKKLDSTQINTTKYFETQIDVLQYELNLLLDNDELNLVGETSDLII